MSASRTRVAGAFIGMGTLHFLVPKPFVAIVPDYLPAHRELVYASGVAEAAGGLALLSSNPTTRKRGAWWLVATILAVFPANIHMALHPERFPRIPRALLWARLPFQALFIRSVLRAAA
ncbi:hypothetical protein [Conexibacter sp. SYSU D00693]|uniref:DoxX family protein n=1 Tax=Conexibacter sp. SYSU D00693 TaxID=2812560 RepID=UPI00196A82EA|nr:hypothetical protein [Conexibacter sp. SYSU D00693]